jgi:hypothetical protein
MTHVATICDRLQCDEGLPALLDTAYAAFEALLSAAEERQDPASGMFAQFVYAATAAANGRDAILFAPSLPVRPLHPADTGINGRGSGSELQDLATLSEVLCHVLSQATAAKPGHEDQKACRHAARCAVEIHRLLTGAMP